MYGIISHYSIQGNKLCSRNHKATEEKGQPRNTRRRDLKSDSRIQGKAEEDGGGGIREKWMEKDGLWPAPLGATRQASKSSHCPGRQ